MFVYPDHAPKSFLADPNWVTVDSGLYTKRQFDLDEPGYPVPEGCRPEWRVFVTDNDYQERVWVLQARRENAG